MRCFYHPEKDAVALCKSCGKGVCSDCCVDLGKGVACRGRCEEDARGIIQLIEHNVDIVQRNLGSVRVIQADPEPPVARDDHISATITRNMQWARRFGASLGFFHLTIGVILAGWAAFDIDRLTLPLVLGVCFIAYGTFSLVRGRNAPATQPCAGTQTRTR